MPKVTYLKPSTLEKADVDKLTCEFADRAKKGKKIFLELGIIRSFIEPLVPAGMTVTELLRNAGADGGTISNSAYSMKAYRLLCTGDHPVMTVDEFYDKMTFNKCRSVVAACATDVKHPVTPGQCYHVIMTATNAVDEMESLRTTGMSLADAKAAAEQKAAAAVTPVTSSAPAPTGDPLADSMAAAAAMISGAEVTAETETEAPAEDPAEVTEKTEEVPAETETVTETEAPAEVAEETAEEEIEVTEEEAAELDAAETLITAEDLDEEVTDEDTAAYVVETLDELAEEIQGIEDTDSLKSIFLKLSELHAELAERLESKVVKMPKTKAA
jgi:hypothetical protein